MLLAGPAAGSAHAAGEEGFSVSPLRFDVETPAGSKSTHSITVTNATSISQTYTVSKEDFAGDATDPEATPVLLGGQFDSDISGYGWVRNTTATLTVPPDSSRTFSVTVAPPAGATGAAYTAMIISGPKYTSGDVTAISRVAVLFLMNAGGAPPPEIIIDEITTTTGGETIVTYINEGGDDERPEAIITYVDPITGEPVEEIEADRCTTALPGYPGQCTFAGPSESGLVPISTGEVTLVTGAGDRITAGLPTRWAGSWTSLLLPLVGIGLFVMYFLFLRRRMRDDEEDEALDGAAP